jgi:hypothetical protein
MHQILLLNTWPDLTQPEYVNRLLSGWPLALAVFTLAIVGITLASAILALADRSRSSDRVAVGDLSFEIDRLLKLLYHAALVSMLVGGGWIISGSLAQRYQQWEQAKIDRVAPAATGELIQQTSPQISYTTTQPYTYTTELEGKLVKVQDNKPITKTTKVNGSNLQVTVNPRPEKGLYAIDFRGDYQVSTPIDATDRAVFQFSPPTGYSLLQNLTVTQAGKQIIPAGTKGDRFPLVVATKGTVENLRVTYRALGSPQWVYAAKDGALANFRLNLATQVPGSTFVSSIPPTKTTKKGGQQILTWAFDRNTAVQKPFGIAVVEPVASATGLMPLLLTIAPAILLWWLLLLYFSIPMSVKNVAVCGAIFFAAILALAYLSRLMPGVLAWTLLSLGWLGLVWGLGKGHKRVSTAAIICTLLGAIVPIFGCLTGYRGLTASLAGILSVLWLALRNWYDWYSLEPKLEMDRSPESFVRHDLLDEIARQEPEQLPPQREEV